LTAAQDSAADAGSHQLCRELAAERERRSAAHRYARWRASDLLPDADVLAPPAP
jgi:hypothetical protein